MCPYYIEPTAKNPEDYALSRVIETVRSIKDNSLRGKLLRDLEVLGECQLRRMRKRSSDDRRRFLIGAMVPNEAAARYKRIAAATDRPITKFAADAFETEYEKFMEAFTAPAGAHE